MEKPIKEWLKELPEPIRELAIKRHEEGRLENKFMDSIYDALNGAFDWERTKEGDNFWYAWYCFVDQNSDSNNVFTDPKDYSGLPMPDGFSLQNEPPEWVKEHELLSKNHPVKTVFMAVWIPITEKTPANNQKVLVCWSHTPVWEPSEAYYVDGKFYPDRGAAPYFRVTHWMEMPKGVTE